jgi:hypothetical protein
VSTGDIISLSIAGLSLVFAGLVFYATTVRSAEIRLFPVDGNCYLAAGGLSNGIPSDPTITITILASNLGSTGGLLQAMDVSELHKPWPTVLPLAMRGGDTGTVYLVGHFNGGTTDVKEFRRHLDDVERLEATIRWRYWRTKRPLRALIRLAHDEHEATWEETTVEISVANMRRYVEENSPPLDQLA